MTGKSKLMIAMALYMISLISVQVLDYIHHQYLSFGTIGVIMILVAIPGILRYDDRFRILAILGSVALAIESITLAFFDSLYDLIPGVIAVVAMKIQDDYSVKELFSLPAERKIVIGEKWKKMLSAMGIHTLLITVVLIVVFPAVWVISTSLKPHNTLTDTELKIWPDRITFDHYNQVLFHENIGQYFMNSLIVSVGTTLLGIFLASTAAYALSRYDFFGKKAVIESFLLVQMFPGVIIIVPYFIILKTYGLLNSYIGLIAAYSVTALPLCLYMIKGFFDTIPRDLEEAAMVDGASPARIFLQIILPLAKPAIAVTALFSFLSAWNEYLLAYTFMLDDKYYTLPVKIYTYVSGTNQQWGTFAATSVMVSIPVIILFMISQKYLISGMTAGGVKG